MTTLPEHIAALRAALEAGPTPGPWIVATSNSWRRIISESHGGVCVPTVYSRADPHPDLHFPNGGAEGPDANFIAAAHPESIRALLDALDEARRDAERYRFIRDADRSDCITPELGLYAMDSLDEYVDAAMEDEIRNAALATGA